MTTMGYLLDDKNRLRETAWAALQRRRQLCPWELTHDELIDVMHSPAIALRVRDLWAMRPKALYWCRSATLILPTGDEKLPQIRIKLDSKTPMPLASAHSGPPELYTRQSADEIDCWAGPQTVRLLDWAWKATQVEFENRWAKRIIGKLISATTTHQQVHRYMPELYNLLAHQEEVTIPKTAWNRSRIVDVHNALKEIGSKRATKIELPLVTLKDRANLKNLVVHTLLLPVTDGLGADTVFERTWVDHPWKVT